MHAKWNTRPSNRETDDGPIRTRQNWNWNRTFRTETELEPKIGATRWMKMQNDLLCWPLYVPHPVHLDPTHCWPLYGPLAGENHHYCVTELATRDPPLQPDPLDLNQHSQRRIGRNFCLNKRTFLHQPQNSSVVVCWGSTDVPLVDSRGADSVRAWWHDAEGKSLMYNVTFELAIFSEYVFCLYFYLCICVLLQLKTIWSNKCTSRLY